MPTYRFYFDGDETSQFEIDPSAFGEKSPFLSPLAGSFVPEIKTIDFRIVRSFVPMAYRTSAKVTSTVRPAGGVRTNGRLVYDPKTTGLFTAAPYSPPTRNVAGRNARIGAFEGRGQMVYGTFSLRGGTVRG